jgi:hypothetical protein
MTICIAAICDNGHGLVLAADREIGIGITSAEFPDGKFYPLFYDWHVGLAGTVTHAADVIDAARTSRGAPRADMPSLSVHEVRDSVEDAYRTMRLRHAESLYLANRGLTLKEFRVEGRHDVCYNRRSDFLI